LVKRASPAAASPLVPVKQFCCGFTVATCGQQCAVMNNNGYWYAAHMEQVSLDEKRIKKSKKTQSSRAS
jgi:hypothetical protein